MRLLTKTLAVVSILAPASAYSLGIGEIKLHSALNQNLNAEIALQLSGENVSEIKVNLAPPEKFDEAGVAWNYYLSKIKFETVTRANGSVVIKLTSREALKEPFLDLLLEVSWPKGSLYREFTVLVDPPSVYNQATIPVPSNSQGYIQQLRQSEESQSTGSAQQAGGSNGAGSADAYGPTRRNDTLWGVSEGLSRQMGVSVEQMMMALYQANPNAFYKDNVNAMMAGKTLKIPEKDVVVKLSRSQALTEFNKQSQAWKNRLASVPAKPTIAAEGEVDNQLKLVAPTETTVADDAVVATGNDQAAKSEKKSAGAAVAPTSSSPADAAIQSKIAALEKQLEVMQQLIALKDQQLAAIQNQAQLAQAKPEAQEPVVSPEPVPTSPINPALTAPEPTPQPIIEAPVVVSPTQQPISEPVATPVPQPAAVVKPTEPPAVVQPEIKVEQSSDLYYMAVSGVGAAVLGLLGWLLWRKRNVEEETSAESMFASSSLIKVPEDEDIFSSSTTADTTSYTVGESSFLSEFTPSDFNSFDTDQGEIDPISEADVYLAYGRYQQAEELMRHAIIDHPDRDECKLKLVEIYYASENKQAFLAYVDDLVKLGKNKQVDFWAKVAEMGEELCPGVALFSSGEAYFAIDEPIAGNKPDSNVDAEDLDFGLVSFDELPVKDKTPAFDKGKDSDLDYDLTSFDVEGDIFDVEDHNNQDIDFDLGSFEKELVKAAGADKSEPASLIDDLETFDFNFDAITTEKTPAVKTSLNTSEQKITPAKELSLDDSLSFDSDDFDFSYSANKADKSDKVEEFAVSDLTDMDELETKLDLAKAYIDMGDIGAARDIASEVLTKGTDAQKVAAKELLDDLT